MAKNVLNLFTTIPQIIKSGFIHFEEIQLLVDNFSKDRVSDIACSFIQAKRWGNTVGRPEIQKFVGALQGQRARKGIFITTSNFSKDAIDYTKNIDSKIILIDGNQLSELMIENNVGVSQISAYEVKKIDSDYFIED